MGIYMDRLDSYIWICGLLPSHTHHFDSGNRTEAPELDCKKKKPCYVTLPKHTFGSRSHLFVSRICVDDVVEGEQWRAHVAKPLGAYGHCRCKASIEAGGDPCGAIIRARVLDKVEVCTEFCLFLEVDAAHQICQRFRSL